MTLKSKEAVAILVNLICAKTFLMVPVYFKRLTESGSLLTVLFIFGIASAFLLIFLLSGKISIPKILFPVISLVMVLVCSINLFEYSRTVSSLFFRTTPVFLIVLFFTVATVSGAYADIGKLNLFFVPIIYATVFIMLIFTFSDGNYYYLFPVMGKGADYVFSDGFFMLSSLFELVVLFFIPNMLENKRDIKRVTAFTLIFSFVIYLIITAGCLITVHTSLPENCFSPLFLILRQIKIGTYFQHPDTAFLIIYFLSAFLYLSTMVYFAAHILSKTCRKLSKKVFFIPFGIIIFTLGLNGEMLMPLTSFLNKCLWIVPFILPIFARRSLK